MSVGAKRLECKICSLEFDQKRGGKIYCSDACRRAAELLRYHDRSAASGMRKRGGEFKCERCGDDFILPHSNTLYCPTCRKMRDREKASKYRDENPGKVSASQSAQTEKRRGSVERQKVRKRRAIKETEQRRTDPTKRLNHRMSEMIRSVLRGRKSGTTWTSLVGYSIEDLRRHIERQFLPGMNWENMGDWHIDHIVAKSSFRYADAADAEFQSCWALSNLRPLWAADNMSKGKKPLYLI